MSGLESSITAGGVELPVPTIGYIEINTVTDDEGTADQLIVNLSLRFQGDNLEIPSDALDALSDLNIYVIFVMGNTKINQIISAQRYHDIFFALKTSLEDGVYYVPPSDEESADIEITKNYIQVPFSDFVNAEEPVYDDGLGEYIYKYITSVSLSMNGTYTTFSELFSDVYTSDEDGVSYKDLSVFCFSSVYDFEGVAAATDGIEVMKSDLENYYLFTRFNSVVSYEKVFENGMPFEGIETVWRREDGTIYSGEVIQTLDGEFHEASSDANFSVIAAAAQSTLAPYIDPPDMSDLVGTATTPSRAQTQTALNTGEDPYLGDAIAAASAAAQIGNSVEQSIRMYNNGSGTGISVAAGPNPGTSTGTMQWNINQLVAGSPANILTKLNTALAAIPSRSTATPAGKMYEQLANFVAQQNASARSNSTVAPTIARDPKIIDARAESMFGDYATPETEPDSSTSDTDVEITPDRIYGLD